MKIQESAENYLETILMLQNTLGKVRSIDVVNELNFSKPSISKAMKQFRENNLITIDENGFIILTASGMEIAKAVYERHLVLTKYLMTLGVTEETAKEDACRIEHVISKESFKKIKEALNDTK